MRLKASPALKGLMYLAGCTGLGTKCTGVAKWFNQHGYMDVNVSIIQSGGQERCYSCDRCSGWEDECVPPCCDPDLSQESVIGVVTMKDAQGKTQCQ